MTEISLSIRELVESTRMQGDIDNRFKGLDSAREGAEIHRKLQSLEGDDYQSEVSFKGNIEVDGYNFKLSGRADGVIINENGYCIDEIKTTVRNLEDISINNMPMHYEQAVFYGYFCMLEENIENIMIQLRYVHRTSEEIKKIEKQISFKDAKIMIESSLERYLKRYRILEKIREKRNKSIKNFEFPYGGFRSSQREFCVGVYRTIEDKKNLFVQAPTGTGKTISTLFPTIKAMGEGFVDKIFYVTAKTLTQKVANETMIDMENKGLNIKRVWITAKEKVCKQEKVKCRPDYCPYAKGYYDRLGNVILDIIQENSVFNKEKIDSLSEKFCLCPFELSLDLSLMCDFILCDYNYVFDPRVSLKRFTEEVRENYIYLVDEGHNLVDRAREMYGCKLNKSTFFDLRKQYKDIEPKLYKAFSKINKKINECFKNTEEEYFISDVYPEKLERGLLSFKKSVEKFLVDNPQNDTDKLVECYFEVVAFIKLLEFFDSYYTIIYEQKGKERSIRLFCLDPGPLLQYGIKRTRSTIVFSATLTPLDYFKEILGGNPNDYLMSLPSPFNKEKLGVFIDPIDTRYKNRGKSAKLLASHIKKVYELNKGNYIVFFPSYAYLEMIYDELTLLNLPIIKQNRNMNESEKDDFLIRFENERDNLVCAVMGSHFSEGINLIGDSLIGVFIIGVGLPMISLEKNLISEYFSKMGDNGYDFSYKFPGMNKVLQACGRVIRTEKDRGIVYLMDKRYLEYGYKFLFPKHWNNIKKIYSDEYLVKSLKLFWKE